RADPPRRRHRPARGSLARRRAGPGRALRRGRPRAASEPAGRRTARRRAELVGEREPALTLPRPAGLRPRATCTTRPLPPAHKKTPFPPGRAEREPDDG